MDLLEQYKQQNPEAFREKKPAPAADEYGRTYTGIVALVMRFSGGKIRNSRQAILVLLIFAAITAALSFFFFFYRQSGTLRAREKAFLNQGKNPESYDKMLFPQ